MRSKLASRSAITLVELLIVLVILALLAAVAIPSILGFIEAGRQRSRMDTARTLYLAAQNRLTELKITKRLDTELASAPTVTDSSITGTYGDIRYISKSKGSFTAEDPVEKLLAPVIMDNLVLYDAILIEFDIRTGVVLSVFYSDALPDSSSFAYSGDDSFADVSGDRGMDNYDAAGRRQGYYGVTSTGTPESYAAANAYIYDNNDNSSNLLSIPGEELNPNVLYACFLIPKDQYDGNYELQINGVTKESIIDDPYYVIDTDRIIIDDSDVDLVKIIWLLDYISGDTVLSVSKYAKALTGEVTFTADSNITVGIRGNVSATSLTQAHPYFYTENHKDYEAAGFKILTQRHLHNMRFAPGSDFALIDDIDFTDAHSIENFTPIPDFSGTFKGFDADASYVIANLNVDTSSVTDSNAGLFAEISRETDGAAVVGLTFENPQVSGGTAGTVCGTLESGVINGIYVRYTEEGKYYKILGTDAAGGIAGSITGTVGSAASITDSVFISPYDTIHIECENTPENAGGIAGTADSSATIRRVLFLALAPENGDEDVPKIFPICGGTASAAPPEPTQLYLSGIALRPDEPRDYNLTETNGYGLPISTVELFELGENFASGWISPLASSDPLNLDEDALYPYPIYNQFSTIQTADLWPVVQKDYDLSIELFDSYDTSSPDNNCQNLLYADIQVPVSLIEDTAFTLSFDSTGTAFDLTFSDDMPETLLEALADFDFSVELHLMYRCDDVEVDGETFARIILVLDYVGGNMTADDNHSIGVCYPELAVLSTLKAKIEDENGFRSAESNEIDPLFFVPSEIYTARHLYNIRYRPDANYTQQNNLNLNDDPDFAVTNFAPIPAYARSYDGGGNVIENLVVGISGTDNAGLFATVTGSVSDIAFVNPKITGDDNTGVFANVSGSVSDVSILNPQISGSGNTGVFGAITGSVSDVTLINPQITGGNNTGGFCGYLTGSISGAYLAFYDDLKTISGGANTGGIAGYNDGGSISDTSFISPYETLHIIGTDGSTGGIAGLNSGDIQRTLFLALAPSDGLGGICPIIASGTVGSSERLYYLAGEPIRPAPGTLTAYNTETNPSGVGEAATTTELAALTDFGTAWQTNTGIADPLDTANTVYPYPYYKDLTPPDYPDWPIADIEEILETADAVFAYYERYSGGSYGFWTLSENSLRDDAVITEAGYTLVLSDILSGGQQLYARSGAASGDWSSSDLLADPLFSNTSDLAAAAYNAGLGTWAAVLPLDELAAVLNGDGSALQIMCAIPRSGGSPQEVQTLLHPLFAKGLYNAASSGIVPSFSVRTPWQMTNIAALTNTAGISFLQELNLDFTATGLGVNAPVSGVPYSIWTDSVIPADFNGTFDGNDKIIKNLEMNVPHSGAALFVKNFGTIKSVFLRDSTIEGRDVTSGIAAYNAGLIENCSVRNLAVTGIGYVGAIAASNYGTVKNVTADRVTVGGTSYVGGITGENGGTVEFARIADSAVTASSYSGGIAAKNADTGRILLSAAVNAAIAGNSEGTGGICGNNAGTIEDVFYQSASDYSSRPVSDSGGGIVGINSGSVTRSLYLAPAPRVPNAAGGADMYPIVRTGNAAGDSNFYLSGSRYSLDYGRNWIHERYNRPGSDDSVSGGGIGIITKFIDTEWLDYAYHVSFPNWYQPASGYPYPVIAGMPIPSSWTETESPARPDQVDRLAWDETLPTTGRAINLGFLNADFTDPYPRSAVTDRAGQRRDYVNMDAVNGWRTRPVNASDYSRNWNVMEFQEPINISNDMYNEYMYTNYEGNFNTTLDIQTSQYRYAELNADVQGTLYQLCPTTPGAQFYYSFYHASRLTNKAADATDRMSFYLTGVSNDALYARDDELVLVRPCWSPRSTMVGSNYNPSAANTVAYGNSHDLSYYKDKFSGFPSNGRPYLYDVWIAELGYGITFWSTENLTIGSGDAELPRSGVSAIDDLPVSVRNDAYNRVIGYWGVSFGWKHYYGLYTVPEGQVRTEFAFQSNTASPQYGNYLDGISFKAPSFLSIEKYIKLAPKGRDVMFVKPGDTVTVELRVKSWGEIPAGNIVIRDILHPYTQYIKYIGEVHLFDSSGNELAVNARYDEYEVIIEPPVGTVLSAGEGLTVHFNIQIRDAVLGTEDADAVSTLLYYFRNQAALTYRNTELTAFSQTNRRNASGPEPVQVFIDPVDLNKTVTLVGGAADPEYLIDGPFLVTLEISDALPEENAISTYGLLTDIIPAGFSITSRGNLPEDDTTIAETTDGSTRITVRNANLSAKIPVKYWYTIAPIEGSGYGVRYTSISADYKYIYKAEDGEDINVMLLFPQTAVGIKVKPENDVFTVDAETGVTNILDITANDHLSNAHADNNYDVNYTVKLTDSAGNPVTTLVDGNQFIENENFTAALVRGSNNLEFTLKPGFSQAEFTLFYMIELIAYKPGGTPERFNLSSGVQTITINADGG